ncbi:MAG: FlgB family protein [Rhodobacteraceae bacterium]|nr:FlgB family protein [Paracoccaceae bacterium]
MFERLEVMRQAQAMAAHAAARQSAIARNIANADTPGYRPSDLPTFAEVWRDAGTDFALRATRPGHLGAGPGAEAAGEARPRPVPGADSPNGNGVSLETEMMKAAEVRHQHELALSIYQNALGVLRTSLGRPR